MAERCLENFIGLICLNLLHFGGMSPEMFRYSMRVTYSLCTIGDHIYYSRYLDVLEAARGEFFRAIGDSFSDWQRRGTIFPVIESHVFYRAPAHYDDQLLVELWVMVAERARLNFGYRITNQSATLILEAETRHVCCDLDNKPRRVPEDLVARLQPFIGAF